MRSLLVCLAPRFCSVHATIRKNLIEYVSAFAGEDMTAAMSAGAATVTGGVAKASSAVFDAFASLKLQAIKAGNSITIRRVDAQENQGEACQGKCYLDACNTAISALQSHSMPCLCCMHGLPTLKTWKPFMVCSAAWYMHAWREGKSCKYAALANVPQSLCPGNLGDCQIDNILCAGLKENEGKPELEVVDNEPLQTSSDGPGPWPSGGYWAAQVPR